MNQHAYQDLITTYKKSKIINHDACRHCRDCFIVARIIYVRETKCIGELLHCWYGFLRYLLTLNCGGFNLGEHHNDIIYNDIYDFKV